MENPLSTVPGDCAISCLNEFSCPILAGLWLGEGLVEYISGTLMQLGWFIYYKNLLFFLTTFALVTWLWCEHLIPLSLPSSSLPHHPIWGPDSREFLSEFFSERNWKLRVATYPKKLGFVCRNWHNTQTAHILWHPLPVCSDSLSPKTSLWLTDCCSWSLPFIPIGVFPHGCWLPPVFRWKTGIRLAVGVHLPG